jgi:hypothetical protein
MFFLSFQQIVKLRTGRNEVGDEALNPALLNQTDPSLLVYPAWQLLRALNETGELRATLPILINVTSRHMTFGQASILVDAFQNKENGTEVRHNVLMLSVFFFEFLLQKLLSSVFRSIFIFLM